MNIESAVERFVSRLGSEHVVIYVFHGVIERQLHEVRNYTRKHLEVGYFRKLLAELKARGNCISMDILASARSAADLPSRPFLITFDDGFENNLSVAAPVLKDFSMSATFYVTTGFIDDNAMSWIDRVEHCVERTPHASVRVPWRCSPVYFSDVASKVAFLREVRQRVKNNAKLDVEALVSAIHQDCGQEMVSSSDDPLDRKLSWQQVRELASDRDFIIGGHSHRHQILSFLSEDELRTDIHTSLSRLKEKADVGAYHYSYPEGGAHCYSPLVISMLMGFGVRCCPTAIDGVNYVGDDLFHLRRVMIE